MKFFFTPSSWLLLVVAAPSALGVAKKEKKMKNTKNKKNFGPIDNDNDGNNNLGQTKQKGESCGGLFWIDGICADGLLCDELAHICVPDGLQQGDSCGGFLWKDGVCAYGLSCFTGGHSARGHYCVPDAKKGDSCQHGISCEYGLVCNNGQGYCC